MSSTRQYGALLRTLLNVNFGISYGRQTYLVEKKRLWEPIGVILAIVFSGGTLLFGYVKLLNSMYTAGQSLGQGNMVLTLVIVAGQVMVLILGLFWVLGVFYFSHDNAILVPLPIPASTVLISKFTVVMVNEYITMAVLLIPAFVVYGVRSGAGILYWLVATLAFLLVPVLPLAIASAAAIVMMRLVNLRRSKTFFMIVGAALFLGLYFWFQYRMMNLQPGTTEDMMAYLMTVQDSLSRNVAAYFPPSLWASIAMSRPATSQGALNLLLFVGSSAIAVAVVLALASRLFYAGLLAGNEVPTGVGGGARRAGGVWAKLSSRNVPFDALWRQRSAETAIALKDMCEFFHTPTFALNGAMNTLILPGLMAVWFILGRGSAMFADVPGLEEYLAAPKYELFRTLIFAGVVFINSGLHVVSSTSFSREGRNMWVLKSLPVSSVRKVFGKMLFALGFDVAASIPMGVVLQLILKLRPGSLLVAIAIGLLGTAWVCFAGFHLDMLRPFLTWDNPQAAMKSNLNGLIVMLATMAVTAGLIGYPAYRGIVAGWSGGAVLAMVFMIVAALAVGWYLLIMRSADRALRRIEV